MGYLGRIVVIGLFSLTGLETLISAQPAEIKEETELMFGEAIDQEIKTHFTVEEDQEVNKAVQEIGERLVAVSDRKALIFRFIILHSERVNAFSGPGGYVYVTTELLNFAKNRDEVAGVLAHEIAHVCLRHVVKRIGDRDVLPESKQERDELARFVVFQGYTLECENEADKLGILYTRRAGYNPCGIADFFERLYASQPRVIFYGFFDSFLQARTTGQERVKGLRELIANLPED